MTFWAPVLLGVVGFAAGSLLFLGVALLLSQTGRVAVRLSPSRLPTARILSFSLLLGVMSALEELIFRGVVLGLGSAVIGSTAALALSTILFAAAHRTAEPLTGWAWLNLILVGALLGFVYLGWGLLPAIGLHWGWNQWEWGLCFHVSGERTTRQLPPPSRLRSLIGYPYGPEAHPTATVVLTLGALGIWFLLHAQMPGLWGPGHLSF